MIRFQFDSTDLLALEVSLQPAYFVGLLHACIVTELQRPEPDTAGIRYALNVRDRFVQEQKDEESETGLLPLPVYWTDIETAEMPELDEVLALAPVCHPFLLCSSIAPHARWAVKFSSEDNEPSFFEDQESAQTACNEAMEEGRRQRAEVTMQAFAACRAGDVIQMMGALNRAGREGFDLDVSVNHTEKTLTIDGHTESFGSGAPNHQESDVINKILGGFFDEAENIAFRHNLPFHRNGDHVEFAGRIFPLSTNIQQPAVVEPTEQPAYDGA